MVCRIIHEVKQRLSQQQVRRPARSPLSEQHGPALPPCARGIGRPVLCGSPNGRKLEIRILKRSVSQGDVLTKAAIVPGLEKTVAPLKAPSKMRIGVITKRGPISISDIWGGPDGCAGSFSGI
jgi:hypothetical protein